MRLLALLLLLVPGLALAQPSPTALCRAAIAAAEREYSIPAGLLGAIGRVESGRRDPATGEEGPWPWTMNAEGRGKFFPTKAEAVAEVGALRAGGMRIIDVGCMQINLHHHPNAFASLEEAFDPLANARYAARFLQGLQASAGDWMVAAGHYHSQTPGRSEAYRAQVALRLPEEQRAGAAPSWQPGWSNQPRASFGMAGLAGMSIRASPPPTVIRTAGAAPEAGRGRDLDAYRAMAIPLATRSAPLLLRGLPGARG
ncbi:lytic transglycosylase domain-containing protein [Roseomonas nepalensis]|uniref:Lytic transglycosylase domain-containing protein n=1 Tax=Muricoccus nepalensis TaxID=1854500 RepID=A0A502G1F4_9PROT|nr:transglycosylase SLT domain-containing protein [Roseomonas nepalensis]TPG55688.1 lytic transglycosylase domain-containing protein [Roseomonas nepalensis]